jgi:hypothetical protein
MARSEKGDERESAKLFGLPSRIPVLDAPVTPLCGAVSRRSRPLEGLRPHDVRHPVTLPVVRARIDEHAHTALEQPGHVVLRRVRKLVHVGDEELVHGGRAACEVVRGGDAEELARFGLVKVVGDRSTLAVAERAVALLDRQVEYNCMHNGGGGQTLVKSNGFSPRW